VWPACTDAQADSAFYLIALVAKVGVLARVTANDAQAWEVLRKHVTSNGKLSKLVVQLREELRHVEAERQGLAARVTDLETALGLEGIRSMRFHTVSVLEGFDANGSPVLDVAHG
jgi:hypothetical protein